MKRAMCWVGLLLALAMLAGCAASGMTDVKKAGFLGDYSMMKPGGEDRAALLYIKPNADFKQYNKIMFDRVMVLLADNAEYREIDPAMLKELTDYYQNALLTAVKSGYEIVDQPGPGVLRVRTAITGVKPSKPVANTLSTIIPVGIVASGATKVGDVIGNLNGRRGKVQGMKVRAGAQAIEATVPLMEMFGYATDLRSRTQGRATYSMEFDRYDQVPRQIAEAITAKHRGE